MSELKFYEFEDLIYGLSTKDKPPKQVISELIDETRHYHQEITIRPSGLVEFLDNSLAWATKQILGVHFPSSYATTFGDICHSASDYCYTHLIEHGRIPPLRNALIAGIKKGRISYYRYLPEKLRDKNHDEYTSLYSIYQEAKVLFTIYYDQVIPLQKPLACEHKMNYQFVDDSGAPLNIKLEGTFDRLEEENVIVDMKTSKMKITGEIVTDDQLDILKAKLKQARLKPKKDDKQLELEDLIKLAKCKPSKSDKQTDIEQQLKEPKRVLKLKRFTDEEKAEAEKLLTELEQALQQEIEHIELTQKQSIDKAENELYEYLNLIEQKHLENIEALENENAPLQAKLDELQHINDCKEAKRKHGKQLAAYALLYMLVYGTKVTEARIELLVRRKTDPFVKSFQFNIEDEIDKLIDDIDTLIEIVTLWRQGTPSRLLFRLNPETFRGSDLTELIHSAEEQDDSNEDYSSFSSAA